MWRRVRIGLAIYLAGFVFMLLVRGVLGLMPRSAVGAETRVMLSPPQSVLRSQLSTDSLHRGARSMSYAAGAVHPADVGQAISGPSATLATDVVTTARVNDLAVPVNPGDANADPAALPGFDDCNTNGTPDASDATLRPDGDCDTNALPDECQPDCNTNLVCDSCDIGARETRDSNENSIPDECETYDELTNGNHNAAPSLGEMDLNSGAGGAVAPRNTGLNGGRSGGGGAPDFPRNGGTSTTTSGMPEEESGEVLASENPDSFRPDENADEPGAGDPLDNDPPQEGSGLIPPMTSEPPPFNPPPTDPPVVNPVPEPPTPEPATAGLLLLGAMMARRRRLNQMRA